MQILIFLNVFNDWTCKHMSLIKISISITINAYIISFIKYSLSFLGARA